MAKSGAPPVCKTTTGSCVQCVLDGECGGSRVCTTGNTCCTPESDPCGASNCDSVFNNCGRSVNCDPSNFCSPRPPKACCFNASNGANQCINFGGC